MIKGIGAMYRMRDAVVAWHQGVLDRIHQNSDIVAAARAAARAARPILQPYLSRENRARLQPLL